MQLNGKERLTGYYNCSFSPIANLHLPTETANSREPHRFSNVSLPIRIKVLGLGVRLKESGNCLNKMKFLLILKPFWKLSCILPIFSLIRVTPLPPAFKRERSGWDWCSFSRSWQSPWLHGWTWAMCGLGPSTEQAMESTQHPGSTSTSLW